MNQFENTRPYNDQEIPSAVARVAASPFFGNIVQYLFPKQDTEYIRKEFLKLKTVKEFQQKFMLQALNSILRQTSKGLQYEGFEQLKPEQNYMFIANHRDILLDAALLQVILDKHQLDTSEITFGSNLMQGGLVIDIGKMNKMFRIVRGGSVHDFYRNSMEVSSYMRYAILEKHQSVWIAQRNGRTKDGIDRTDPALVKMIASSRKEKKPVGALAAMHITPVSVSYEWEPCAALKAREMCLSQQGSYTKAPGEDTQSVMSGIVDFKGHVHFTICQPLSYDELAEVGGEYHAVAKLIDRRIAEGYHLTANNRIAKQLLEGITPEETPELHSFQTYLEETCRQYPLGDDFRQRLLGIYGELKIEN